MEQQFIFEEYFIDSSSVGLWVTPPLIGRRWNVFVSAVCMKWKIAR